MPDPVEVSPGRWKVRVFVSENQQTGEQVRRQVTFEANGIRRARTRAREIEDTIRADVHADVGHKTQATSADVVENALSTTVDLADGAVTVAAATETWWALWVRRPRSPTTQRSYRTIIDTHIRSAPFAGTPVDAVTTGDVQRWYSTLGESLSPATVRRIHAVLRQVFDQCKRDRILVGDNPTVLAYKPEARPSDKTFMPEAVLMALIAAAHKQSPIRARTLAFAALTGLRRGEMCGARWSAVDLERGVLIVRSAVVIAQDKYVVAGSDSARMGLHEKGPKAHQTAAIALSTRAVDLAGEQIEWQTRHGITGDPFLWSVNPPFDVALHPDTLTNWFVAAAKDAGVRGFSLHSLRHWQGSQMLADGASLAEVQARLRHRSMATTMGYLHAPGMEEQRAWAERQPRLELDP